MAKYIKITCSPDMQCKAKEMIVRRAARYDIIYENLDQIVIDYEAKDGTMIVEETDEVPKRRGEPLSATMVYWKDGWNAALEMVVQRISDRYNWRPLVKKILEDIITLKK